MTRSGWLTACISCSTRRPIKALDCLDRRSSRPRPSKGRGPARGRPEAVEVRDDRAPRRTAPVAEHDGLVDQRVAHEHPLQLAGGDVLAAGGDDQVFLAVGDRMRYPSSSDLPTSPVCSQPSTIVARVGGLVLPVAFHHMRPTGEDLAVVRDLDLDARDRRADRRRSYAGPGQLKLMTGELSVSPYPSKSGSPASMKPSARCFGKGAPPEVR